MKPTHNDFLPDALKDLLEKSGADYEQNAHSYKFECPRCGKKDKLWILKHNGYFVCWYCQETDKFKGRCEWALKEILGVSIAELQGKLYNGGVPPGDMLDFTLKDFYNDEDLISLPPQLQEVEWPIDAIVPTPTTGERGYRYLLGRGLTPQMIEHYNIRYQPSTRRVLFPVIMNGKLYGWQGRAVYQTDLKILTSDGLRREFMLMFHDNLINNQVMRTPHAIICEGPVDALKATLCGGNVATMGKAVSAPQLELIRAQGIKKIYLALDPDAANEVTRLSQDLGDLDLYLLLPPEGKKDLGECTFEQVLYQFQKAQPFSAGHLITHLKMPQFF
jgi:hypothetical protein